MNTSKYVATATLLCVPMFYGQAFGRDLADLIPGLYGGDGITLAETGGGFPSHAPHFTIDTSASINLLNDQIGREIRAFPISTSSPGGLSYRFDEAQGTYVLAGTSLGPVLAQSSRTLGQGNWSLALTATYFEYDEFDGENLSNLTVDASHQFDTIDPDDSPQSFEHDVVRIAFDIDIEVQRYAFFGTYGVMENLDVSIIVPIVSIDMDVDASAEVIKSPLNPIDADIHTFEGAEDSPNDSANGSETGIGDIVLGAKYHHGERDQLSVASAFSVKLETGDEDNFHGTGSTTLQPAVFAEYKITDFWGVHGNLGYEIDIDDSDENTLRTILGVTAGTSELTGSAEITGRYQLDGDDVGDDKTDLGLGLKWNPVKPYIFSANLLTPLNEDGLRSDLITSIGVEALF